ncbi:hypothetical protein JNUCC1_01393 [Lentibacillus sp. JNUCC-1]|uniref:hypothetical protein n=1 Tax=Lentibacillus sp. JNUCC-1 TaxID=2654513 RepID=UPI0012E8E8A3|nr:hypothetical protein [Lentibacillus sp. JNUCC-1]MUV37587.1 hypothetical protein [Lentibacillus sp. JNUCC-1]
MFRTYGLVMTLILTGLILSGCFGGSDEEAEANGKADTNEQNAAEKENEDNQAKEETENAGNESDSESEESKGVAPKSASEQVSYTQVTWFGGSPKRQAEPGVWYYTADDHPSNLDDTFEWEDEDILLWQIGDEKYAGYDADTEKLEIAGDDLIKIIVSFDEDGPSDLHPDRMPRNYLKVDKDVLSGKSFLVETTDGEELSLK